MVVVVSTCMVVSACRQIISESQETLLSEWPTLSSVYTTDMDSASIKKLAVIGTLMLYVTNTTVIIKVAQTDILADADTSNSLVDVSLARTVRFFIFHCMMTVKILKMK